MLTCYATFGYDTVHCVEHNFLLIVQSLYLVQEIQLSWMLSKWQFGMLLLLSHYVLLCSVLFSSIRPHNASEQMEMYSVCTFVTPGELIVVEGSEGAQKKFTFDHVFAVGTDHQEIYSVCVKNLVEGLAYNGITVGHSCNIIPTQLSNH